MGRDYYAEIDDMLRVLALYQPYAEMRGFGPAWLKMTTFERTADSAYLALMASSDAAVNTATVSSAKWAYIALSSHRRLLDAVSSVEMAIHAPDYHDMRVAEQQEIMVKAAQKAIDAISKAIAIEKQLQYEHPALQKKENTKVAFNDAASPKTEKVEVELSDAELLGLMKMAHELDITFNQFCQRVLQEYVATSRHGAEEAK